MIIFKIKQENDDLKKIYIYNISLNIHFNYLLDIYLSFFYIFVLI